MLPAAATHLRRSASCSRQICRSRRVFLAGYSRSTDVPKRSLRGFVLLPRRLPIAWCHGVLAKSWMATVLKSNLPAAGFRPRIRYRAVNHCPNFRSCLARALTWRGNLVQTTVTSCVPSHRPLAAAAETGAAMSIAIRDLRQVQNLPPDFPPRVVSPAYCSPRALIRSCRWGHDQCPHQPMSAAAGEDRLLCPIDKRMS